jgi:hypothetical protein
MGSTQQLRKEIIKMEKALELAESKGEFNFELESKIQQDYRELDTPFVGIVKGGAFCSLFLLQLNDKIH